MENAFLLRSALREGLALDPRWSRLLRTGARYCVCAFFYGVVAATGAAAISAEAQAGLPRYTILDRGPSLVRTMIDTPGLNAHGDLAIWHVVSAATLQGVVLSEKQTVNIISEGKFSFVYPSDINDRGTVVGSLQMPQDLRFTQAFEWSDHKLKILPTLGGAYAAANALNNAGDAVGEAQIASGPRHAALWSGDTVRDLGLLAQGDYSRARDINDRGDIVGEANSAPQGKPRGILWHQGSMQQLPNLPGGSFCNAKAVNASSEIVGSCDVANGTSHGVIWRAGHIQDLGTLGDEDAPSTALDINASGQVVGSSEVEDGKLRAFLWQQGKMIDLNHALPANSGWLLLVASRINDRGEIAGRGFFRGAIHAYLLRPDTESGAKNK